MSQTARIHHNENAPAKTLSPLLPDDVEAAAIELLRATKRAGITVASAESCTGGLLASLLTDVEGYSAGFERAFVVYSCKAKCELLGLAEEMVDDCAGVSEEVACALA